MANYQILKADIDEKIYENAQQKITGANLNSVLNAMVATLGAEYQFAGVATINTNPEASDAKVFYIANGKGKYTYFSGIEVTEDDVVILYYDTSWHKVATGIASNEKLTELESELYSKVGRKQSISTNYDVAGRLIEIETHHDTGTTVSVKLLTDNVVIAQGIRVRGLYTDGTYLQFGNLTEIGQTITKILKKPITGIDLYNYDANTNISINITTSIDIEGTINERISEVDAKVNTLREDITDFGIVKISPTDVYTNYLIPYNNFHNTTTKTSTSIDYRITSPISVPAHSIIAVSSYGSESRISKDNGDDTYIPLVEGMNNPAQYQTYVNDSDEAINIVINYLYSSSASLSVYIYYNVISDLLKEIPFIEEFGKLTDTTPSVTINTGAIANGNVLTSLTSHMYSDPIHVKRGDLLVMYSSKSATNIAAFAKTDASGTYYEHLVPQVTGTTARLQYYLCEEDGYIAYSGAINYTLFREYSLSDGVISKIIDSISDKKHIGLSVSSEQAITIGDAPYCNITKSRGIKISGSGNTTLTFTLAEDAFGRSFSIGFRIPYETQDVASVVLGDPNKSASVTFKQSTADARTHSGKTYMIEGDHYHRSNFNVKYYPLSSFTIDIKSSLEWSIEIGADGILNDDLPLTPIMVGYDAAYNYLATFPYEGENISIYELHRRLQIPYYVATTKGASLNTEVASAVESGLCELVFYGGGELENDWSKTDGTFAQLIREGMSVRSEGMMYVVSQAVLDRNMYVNIKNTNATMIRHYAFFSERYSKLSQKYGDCDIFYIMASALGGSAVNDFLNFPQVYYGHGIGTPINPNDPYKSNYTDEDGSNTISLFRMWKAMEAQGRVALMKPSDWFAYCSCH